MNKLTTHLSAKAQSFVNSRFARDETGATAVEYGLIVGLIAVAIVAVLVVLGPHLATLFTTVDNSVTGATH
jgi:pilus assembly protein Flp/PilA